ncbi:hypothetical protein BZG01_12680 [Labilibaculum manganireducens]|uniref:TonB-dependent receptor-like beta-barrel domain-containing protein n=1 Tax=Labilibaculum manganireducens TaxID=1940525 RepID=A0A2N3I6S7_9BACT|nr:hypothetical protein [Labilibaculum manganireducens]PKQ66006.1 hypothetical protein BZG01_12680 [Labilibaculum manganireducens]
MKKGLLSVLSIAIALGITTHVHSQEQKDSTNEVQTLSTDSISSKKEEKNRNVMLNADSNTSPRSVNIGLPFRGDILILENDVPVVYWFWPTVPTVAWRYDNSLAKMGLLSFSESALTFGKVGFAVQSSDRDASSKFKGYASVYGNSFGSTRFAATVTGPLSKKGWGYTLSAHQNLDKGNGINYMYTDWYEKATLLKAGIQKKYDKGAVKLLYKYTTSKSMMSNYQPLRYDGDGKTSVLDNFDLGKDSYVVRDGLVPYFDPYTGEAKQADLTDDEFCKSETHSLYLCGEHKFNNDWKLSYSTMYQKANTPIAIQVPISVMLFEEDQQGMDKYYYHDTNNQYTGSVQYTLNQLIPQSDITTWITRAEITKQVNNHSLRLGFTHQYNHSKFVTLSGMYVQSVEANPELLDLHGYIPAYGMNVPFSNEYGGLPVQYSGYCSPTDFTVNHTALYLSDDIKVNNWFRFGVGGRIEKVSKDENRNIYTKEFILDKPTKKHTFNEWNTVGIADFVLNITPNFGLLGDVTYNNFMDVETSWNYPYKDDNGNPTNANGLTADEVTAANRAGGSEVMPRQSDPMGHKSTVLNIGGGIFLNHGTDFSLVSKVTRITKENILSNSATVTNPNGSGERADFSPIFYDISTTGWSTDIVWRPTKNFNLHYLLTLQNPQFKNYSYGAFGVNYNYSNNVIPELSKVLMEIDPSYSFMNGAMRLWFSLRYFGEQNANATNQYFYEPRWENFGGLEYRLSRKAMLKFQVTNFLDQKGVKGQMQGADQITDDRFVGRSVVAGSIRPRTFELSLDLKF